MPSEAIEHTSMVQNSHAEYHVVINRMLLRNHRNIVYTGEREIRGWRLVSK